MPVLNGYGYIPYQIRSIQNQNMDDIEIIIIDDYSKDKTVEEFKKYQLEDKRIKIIENKERIGLLHGRALGVFSAKGKYIVYLDIDDMFIIDDLFDTLYYEAESNNYDIVAFNGFHSNNFNYKKLYPFRYTHEDDIEIHQPKLSQIIYRYNPKIIERSAHD